MKPLAIHPGFSKSRFGASLLWLSSLSLVPKTNSQSTAILPSSSSRDRPSSVSKSGYPWTESKASRSGASIPLLSCFWPEVKSPSISQWWLCLLHSLCELFFLRKSDRWFEFNFVKSVWNKDNKRPPVNCEFDLCIRHQPMVFLFDHRRSCPYTEEQNGLVERKQVWRNWTPFFSFYEEALSAFHSSCTEK